MSDLKAKPDEPVAAGKWNRVIDRLESSEAGFGAGGFGMSRVECQIKNSSGSNRDIGEVLAIDSWDGPDGSNVFEIPTSVVYDCVDPVWHTSISRLVILAEPIPDDGYGLAVISGHCLVSLSAGSGSDSFVMLDPSSLNEMKGSTSGVGRLLAKLSGGDYGLINFRDECARWRYELTEDSQAPAVTTAKLVDRSGTVFHSAINLSDPLSLMDDQVSGDEGFCDLCGNDFEAVQAPC
ncbi:hypothetical protein K227x_62180 [Rubripirellula lacrimiformis]|uniref:Uncharacterized protein n=1 Tax=Rubripirellula lacrimiformis TaxID=1930273 RepID=A0A517NKY4_9BACT|nr:hypothetical protein [Rubripirellula lacrimiformis]QDT07790.1 hypothetical protein K227x_62180 [Rubripirellula lacrimiformis]